MDINRYLQEKKERVDSALERYLPKREELTSNLHRAMQHSLFAGGKRIRPILSIASFEAAGGKGERILPFACALEMIHTSPSSTMISQPSIMTTIAGENPPVTKYSERRSLSWQAMASSRKPSD